MTKKFEMTPIFSNLKVATSFTEDTPPEWLVSKEYKWWWDDYILTLGIGESRATDFNIIRRVE